MAGLKLIAELGGDGSGFDAMMRRANVTKDKFAGAFSGLKNVIAGAFTIGAITNLSRKTVDFASHLRDVSDALRVNVEWFQKRASAARLAGGSEDDLFKFLDTINKSREEANSKPKSEAAQSFARLGFSQGDISGLNAMDFFDRIVKQFADGANAQTTVDVEKVGGRSARNLLAAFYNQFKSDAPIFTEDMINQLDQIGDEFEILKTKLMVNFAPAILFVANAVSEAVNKIKQAGELLGGAAAKPLTKSEIISMAFGGTAGVALARLYGDDATNAAADEINSQKKEKESFDDARIAASKVRAAREKSAPGFDPPLLLEPMQSRAEGRRGPGPQTDSLVGIGNFLGRNPSLVNNIANQQLDIARKQLTTLDRILVAVKSGSGDNGITVPSA